MISPATGRLKILLATILIVFSTKFLWADQTVTGNCNVVIGPDNTLGDITITCLPTQAETANFAPLNLEVSAEGLMVGATQFDLVIKNKTSYATALFSPAWLALQNNQGLALGMACLNRNMDCVSEQYVQPNGLNRLRIFLRDPIPAGTTEVTFLLQGVRYLSAASTSPKLMGFVSWSLPIQAGTVLLMCNEQITCEQQARIQIELRLLNHDPGRIDGVFDQATRNAILNWQRSGDDRRTAPANGCLSNRDITALKVLGVQRSFDAITFDQSCHATAITLQNTARPAVPEQTPSQAQATGSIDDIQKQLARLGYYLGAIDGQWGRKSAMGLRAAQLRLDEPQTGTVEDGLLQLPALATLPDPPDCKIRFSPFKGQLYERPSRFGTTIAEVPQQRFQVLQQIPAPPAYWFQINTGQRIGWVNDFGHIDLTGMECRP